MKDIAPIARSLDEGGFAHVILVVEDDGTPSLTSNRRVTVNITPAP